MKSKTHSIYSTVETKMKREENLTAQHTVLRYICHTYTHTHIHVIRYSSDSNVCREL